MENPYEYGDLAELTGVDSWDYSGALVYYNKLFTHFHTFFLIAPELH